MIIVLLADGFEEIEALTPVAMLRRAGLDVKTVGIMGMTPTGAHGIKVVCDTSPEEIDLSKVTMAVFPGGMPGATNLDESKVVDHFINRAVNEDKFISAICAAPFILGKRGILNGKRAACYPGFENELLGATVITDGCVRDGKIITARAMGKSHDFALEIIEALCDKETRQRLKDAVLY